MWNSKYKWLGSLELQFKNGIEWKYLAAELCTRERERERESAWHEVLFHVQKVCSIFIGRLLCNFTNGTLQAKGALRPALNVFRCSTCTEQEKVLCMISICYELHCTVDVNWSRKMMNLFAIRIDVLLNGVLSFKFQCAQKIVTASRFVSRLFHFHFH